MNLETRAECRRFGDESSWNSQSVVPDRVPDYVRRSNKTKELQLAPLTKRVKRNN